MPPSGQSYDLIVVFLSVEQAQGQYETATRDSKDMVSCAKQHMYVSKFRTLRVDGCSNPLTTTCALRGWVSRRGQMRSLYRLSVCCKYWTPSARLEHNVHGNAR